MKQQPGYLIKVLRPSTLYVYKMYIPFGQAIRLRRIVSDDIVFDERLKELETWFTNRGYNSEKVKPEIERVNTMNRADL